MGRDRGGGGTAGAVAGVAAARSGARVLVVEAQGSLGGTGTNAWVTPLMRNVSGGQNLNLGLTDEIKARLRARGTARWTRTGTITGSIRRA
ncbi:FAD-dependent oxidoreductase [Deinococcus aquaticus]|uniref:FAD-dependent oxidoreductase n=1 Tax=Deinococcus aquaticus TaxID=328692 RepID=UPI00360C9E88